MSKQVEPLGDRVLIRRAEAAEASEGGIILPDAAKERPHEGLVLASGPACEHLSPDDNVIFSSYAGTSVVADGEELLLMSEEDVLARLVEREE